MCIKLGGVICFTKYTRGIKSITSAEAIKRGIAPDGGLFVPESKVTLTLEEINELANMSYQEGLFQYSNIF
jgi:threonine synthase